MTYTTEELERVAYITGDTRTAEALAQVIDLTGEVEDLENQLDYTTTLDKWNEEHGPADDYREFFYDCFDQFTAHYPAPSVTSDYDKSVIFQELRFAGACRALLEQIRDSEGEFSQDAKQLLDGEGY